MVICFRTDIRKIAQELAAILKRDHKDPLQLKFCLLIILATIPTGLMGILFKDWFESMFSKPKVVGGMLLITGMILWLTRRVKNSYRSLEKMRWMDAILIGIAQGVAIIPGISRSGATISTGLFLGLDRELAGKFSFLLSIPAILGATVLEFRKMDSGQELGAALIGTAAAFGVGILSLIFLMKIIKVGKIHQFSYYCWSIGIIMTLFAP